MAIRNLFRPVIDAATRQAADQIQGTNGGSGVFSSAPPPVSLTKPSPSGGTGHSFMIGFDAIGDPDATFESDGQSYDFGN
jgi:hypothetical protein